MQKPSPLAPAGGTTRESLNSQATHARVISVHTQVIRRWCFTAFGPLRQRPWGVVCVSPLQALGFSCDVAAAVSPKPKLQLSKIPTFGASHSQTHPWRTRLPPPRRSMWATTTRPPSSLRSRCPPHAPCRRRRGHGAPHSDVEPHRPCSTHREGAPDDRAVEPRLEARRRLAAPRLAPAPLAPLLQPPSLHRLLRGRRRRAGSCAPRSRAS